jgi:CubicO group peptidase (beta-lactamase class C family)
MKAFIVILLFAYCNLTFGQSNYKPPVFTDTDRMKKIESAFPIIEKLFKEHAERNHFPAMAYGIVVDGKLVFSGATGYTNVEKKIEATSRSAFRIASMSKSFTAMAILKLRDAGKLQLDDPASKYIPEMKNLKYIAKDAPPITIRHLLTHSAGFPEDNPWGDRQLDDTPAELVDLIKAGVSFSNVPGYEFEYSNLGFALLGAIVSKVSGKPYQQYIAENIFQPLGMKDSKWEYTKVPSDQLALGYNWVNGKWTEEPLLHDGSYGAMGGLICSIEDFGKYVALHLSAWPPRNDEDKGPIKRSSLREMQHPWAFSGLNSNARLADGTTCPLVAFYAYGLGWDRDCRQRVRVGHSGGLPGFGSQWRILPDYGIGVVSFANLTYAGTGSINTRVLDTLISIAGLTPRTLPASDILEKKKNEIMKLLPDWNNAEASGLFAENFFKDNSIDTLRYRSNYFFNKAGKIINVGKVMPQNQLRGEFLIEGENSNIGIFFTLTPETNPLIQALYIIPREKRTISQ